MSLLSLILQIAGPIFFMSMQVSYLNTSYKIYIKKQVGGLSPIPFLSLMTNSAVWSLYGSLKSDETIFVPNATGLIAGFICTVIYHHNSTLGIPGHLYFISASIIIFTIICGIAGDQEIIGSFGVCLAVFLMGSPLSTLRTVINERSTSSLPFFTSLTTFGNALSWSLYGLIIAHDPMVYIPNLLGLLLAIFQLILFVIFGFAKDTAIDDNDRFFSTPSTEVTPIKHVTGNAIYNPLPLKSDRV